MVLHPYKFPWNVHGYLEVRYKGASGTEVFHGSGTMITPHHFITAGHNLRIPEAMAAQCHISDLSPISVNFFPGYHEGQQMISVQVNSYFVHKKWAEDEAPGYDYGLVSLDTAIGNKIGHASFQALSEDTLRSAEVNITGYPAEKMLRGVPQMYTMAGLIDVVKSRNFFYNIDTSGGQSGSGIWIDEKGKVICCGIHTTGGHEYNSAVRVTEEVVDQVKAWITNMYEGEDERKVA